MNTTTNTAAHRQSLRWRMAVQRGVEASLNRMITDMQALVDDPDLTKSTLERHQFTNLLAVSLETPSVELVKNFIFYQMGRDTKGDGWRYQRFGDKLVKALHGLRQQAQGIAQDAIKQLTAQQSEPTAEQIDQVWIEMVRQYVGQLNRYFYYKKA